MRSKYEIRRLEKGRKKKQMCQHESEYNSKCDINKELYQEADNNFYFMK